MRRFRVAEWSSLLHYAPGSRRIIWIKSYVATLDDGAFARLQDEEKAHLLLIRLLAARSDDGSLPWDPHLIQQCIRSKKKPNLAKLRRLGFIEYTVAGPPGIRRLRPAPVSEPTPTGDHAPRPGELFAASLLDDIKPWYPKRRGAQPWKAALRAINARLREGESFDLMVRGTQKYAEFCRLSGKEDTQYVMQARRFFGPDKHYAQGWDPEVKKRNKVSTTTASVWEEK